MSDKCIIGFWDTLEMDRALRIAASEHRVTKSELLRAILADWLRSERSTAAARAGESPADNLASFGNAPLDLVGDQGGGEMIERGE